MSETSRLSHYDDTGSAHMVDVGGKQPSVRMARAHAFVAMAREVIDALPQNPKGNPLEVARIAGIQAAKRTADLIPLCHALPLSYADVRIHMEAEGLRIETEVRTQAQTGVEMEALTAAAIAALTIYDMTKAMSKAIEIREVFLLEKTGGKSGDYRR
ncbi:MAG: cyclic pyranopterin monophosphate synthase MoaC [Bryobacterales bacterium]|nr:cyclic pyranopterin monophosphate synthase MoaC [Bryobacterales bacterium]